MNTVLIMLGLILLILGRKLFWLFVAIAGFLAGMEFTSFLLPNQPVWLFFLAGLGFGLVGMILAILAQRLGFALAGFYGGAYLLFAITQFFGVGDGSAVLPFIGGVIGAVSAVFIMDWALIVLSALAGSGAIIAALDVEQTISTVLFVLITAAGIVAQRLLMKPVKRAE